MVNPIEQGNIKDFKEKKDSIQRSLFIAVTVYATFLLTYYLLLNFFCFNFLLEIKKAFWIIFISNSIIVLINHIFHFCISIKLSYKTYLKDHVFESFSDCYARCIAGFLEMVFYTISFATGHYELVVGYLVLKTISAWGKGEAVTVPFDKKTNDEQETIKNEEKIMSHTKQGPLSTTVLRIATVIALMSSLIAAQFIPLSIINFLKPI